MVNPSTPFTLPQLGPPNLANGDSGAGGQNDWASYQQMRPYLRNLLTSYYDVRMYGASPSATPSQNQVAFQLAAFDAAMAGVGGVLYIPAGRYQVMPIATNGSSGTQLSALSVPGGVTVCGDGPNATVLVMAANAPNQSYLIHNYNVGALGGDTDITISGIGIDGNAANQAGTTDAQYGCRFFKARRVTIFDCVFKDVFGTTDGSVLGPNGTPGEGFAQQFDNSADCFVINSVAYATNANTASGFASNQSTNVQRVNCASYGWGHAMGFTDWTSADIVHSNCRAYLNGAHGFNVELSTHAIYSGCISGGVATSSGAFPFTNGQSLGNTKDGFHQLGSDQVQLIGCTGANNSGNGTATTSTPAGHVWVQGGVWTNNTLFGLLADVNQANRLIITGSVVVSGNGSGAISTGGTPATMNVLSGIQSPPPVPATTVALGNPFHIPMLVNIVGGTVSAVALSGTVITGVTSGQVRLGAGDSITLTYSAAPTWQWFGAL